MAYYTEVKVAQHQGDIGELVRKYSDKFVPFPFGDPNNKKCILPFRENDEFYLFIISYYALPKPDYNIIITTTGEREKRVKGLMQELLEKLGIETAEAPDDLRERFENLGSMVAMLTEMSSPRGMN